MLLCFLCFVCPSIESFESIESLILFWNFPIGIAHNNNTTQHNTTESEAGNGQKLTGSGPNCSSRIVVIVNFLRLLVQTGGPFLLNSNLSQIIQIKCGTFKPPT